MVWKDSRVGGQCCLDQEWFGYGGLREGMKKVYSCVYCWDLYKNYKCSVVDFMDNHSLEV